MSYSEIRIGGVPEHFNLPWHLACEQDLFRDLGATVRFQEYAGGTGQLSAALNADHLDIAVLLLEGAVQQILKGGDFRIVSLFTKTPLSWGIHVAGTSGISTIEQIRGKRYAISRTGSGSHLIAVVDADERGWPLDDLKFVIVDDLAGARRALANGEADVFLWEKFMTKPLVDSGEFRRVGERIVPWPAFVVAVRNSVLDRQANLVLEILKTVTRSCQALKADPAACQVIAQRYQLQFSDAKDWLQETCWNDELGIPKTDVTKVIEFLIQTKLLKQDDYDIGDIVFDLS